MAAAPIAGSTSTRAASGQRSGLREHLRLQLEAQKQYKCDYVLFVYGKDPSSPHNTPPSYILTADPLPVKLSHHVFMQLSFAVLKGRLAEVTQKERRNRGATRERDLVALYMFLCRYIRQINATKKSVEPQGPPAASTQHLRFQLLLEYGLDVKALMDAQPASSESSSIEAYWRDTLAPDGVTEDEFYVALGKPSGMAQECCLM